jgi:hypothetical protein
MTTYRVSFFNDLVNCYGRAAQVWQRTIEIHRARSEDRALEAAKRRFARAEKVACWDLRARRFEVEAIEEAPAPRGRRRKAPR